MPTTPEHPSSPSTDAAGTQVDVGAHICSAGNGCLTVFWVALFDLLSPMEIWHAQAATVSGRGTPLAHAVLLATDAFPVLWAHWDRALAILAQSGVNGVIWSWLQTEQIRVYTCFCFFHFLNYTCCAAGSIIRACLSHSSCSRIMQPQLKRDLWKAFGPDVLRLNVLQKC